MLIRCILTLWLASAFDVTPKRSSPLARLSAERYTIDQTVLDGPLVPITNYMLVKVDADRSETTGGIFLSDKAKEKASSGIVVSVGPGRMDKESGVCVEMPISTGENVLWGRTDGSRVRYCNAEHTMLRDVEISLAWPGDEELAVENVKPLRGNILIKVSDNAGKTASGILLGLKASLEIPLQGVVVAVGAGAALRDGSVLAQPVDVGDMVKFRDFDTVEVVIEGNDYVVINSLMVVCKWKA